MPVTETALLRVVIVLAVLSVLLHGFYYYVQIEVLKLPPYRYPYWWSILGSVMMIVLPIGLWRGGAQRFAFFFMLFTFVTGFGMCYGSLMKL